MRRQAIDSSASAANEADVATALSGALKRHLHSTQGLLASTRANAVDLSAAKLAGELKHHAAPDITSSADRSKDSTVFEGPDLVEQEQDAAQALLQL
jgi:hypothetical protein